MKVKGISQWQKELNSRLILRAYELSTWSCNFNHNRILFKQSVCFDKLKPSLVLHFSAGPDSYPTANNQ